jgi:hypothetical protein
MLGDLLKDEMSMTCRMHAGDMKWIKTLAGRLTEKVEKKSEEFMSGGKIGLNGKCNKYGVKRWTMQFRTGWSVGLFKPRIHKRHVSV